MEQETTNEMNISNDDQEIGRTLSNPSISQDLYLPGSSQEPFFLLIRNRRTRYPSSMFTRWYKTLHWFPLPRSSRDWRLMYHIYCRGSRRTWNRATFNMPISSFLTSITETTYSELHGMTKEEMQHYLNEEWSQDHHD